MNKAEIVEVIAQSAEVSKAVAEKTLNALVSSITNSLARGEPVCLVGFGTLLTRGRKARTGRNPQTGAALQIAASQAVVFKAGKTLKDAVQGKV